MFERKNSGVQRRIDELMRRVTTLEIDQCAEDFRELAGYGVTAQDVVAFMEGAGRGRSSSMPVQPSTAGTNR